jgi:hypothetical protein
LARLINNVQVYLEVGNKRVFAGAIDWPGWCRSGRDEASALEALFAYGSRYSRVLRGTRLGFKKPTDISAFSVVVRLIGNATTDFGAPVIALPVDKHPIDDTELRRLTSILKACWRGFEKAVGAAQGKELRLGPRGGGRDLQKIIQHVQDANGAYLSRVGWEFKHGEKKETLQILEQTRKKVLKALRSTADQEKPTVGPRGGVRWMARYFVRRVAWHILDHAWEIEDRII